MWSVNSGIYEMTKNNDYKDFRTKNLLIICKFQSSKMLKWAGHMVAFKSRMPHKKSNGWKTER